MGMGSTQMDVLPTGVGAAGAEEEDDNDDGAQFAATQLDMPVGGGGAGGADDDDDDGARTEDEQAWAANEAAAEHDQAMAPSPLVQKSPALKPSPSHSAAEPAAAEEEEDDDEEAPVAEPEGVVEAALDSIVVPQTPSDHGENVSEQVSLRATVS